jgi:hypothetical protein
MIARLAVTSAAVILAMSPATAQQPVPIRDNSFLIEEAYNQEFGVVQHVFTFQKMRRLPGWEATFTQEWPAPSERHQLSYTLPVQRADDGTGSRTGVGDLALNYRFQVPFAGGSRTAVAPRLSVLLPTGNEKRGQGSGSIGLEVNLPVSVELSSWLVSHSNVGGGWTPDAAGGQAQGTSVLSYAAGQSLIWLAHPKLNLMLEARWSGEEVFDGGDKTQWEREVLLAPGLRGAIDFPSGLQIVPGVAFPFGLGPSDGTRGIYLYLSLEHPFRRR